jgi:hypothetical protein
VYQAMMQVSMTRGDWDPLQRWWTEGRVVSQRSGLRYFELLHESNLPVWPGVSDLDAALEHYEHLLPVVRSYGAPLLIALVEGGLARVLFARGDRDRARELAREAIKSGELAGPVAYVAILMWAAIWSLDDGIDVAAEPLARAVRIGRDDGNTFFVISCSFIAAAVAARRGDLEATAALLAGAARVADPRGIRGDTEVSRCRAEAEAAVAAYAGDLTSARARGASMTIDDLVNEALRVAEA